MRIRAWMVQPTNEDVRMIFVTRYFETDGEVRAEYLTIENDQEIWVPYKDYEILKPAYRFVGEVGYAICKHFQERYETTIRFKNDELDLLKTTLSELKELRETLTAETQYPTEPDFNEEEAEQKSDS